MLATRLKRHQFNVLGTSQGGHPVSGVRAEREHTKRSRLHVSRAHRTPWLTNEAAKLQGAVYTPEELSAYVAQKMVSFVQASRSGERITAVDPACGDGQLLSALHDEASKAGFDCDLVGMDVDRLALESASSKIPQASFLMGDALCPTQGVAPESGWRRRLQRRKLPMPTLAIANPPWGAALRHNRVELAEAGYTLARGQYDSYELFIELALKLVVPGGLIGFIIPDSLFATKHQDLRRLLLSKSQVLFVARMGEGLFESVFRACAVVICRNSAPSEGDTTQCLRLTPEWRRSITAGETTFAEADAALLHHVPTERFLLNPGLQIDVDIRDLGVATIQKLRSTGTRMEQYLSSARGVELSKNGKVTFCPVCNTWSPEPKNADTCPRCDQDLLPLERDVMVSTQEVSGYHPFIVGEDIERHRIRSHRWLDLSRTGINYKDPELYAGPKLLVRKTGVGISASMDYSDAYTNQVVYVFRKQASLPEWLPIEFAAALICSRAAFFHVTLTNGETEWRSHPYLTQRHVLDLPAPNPEKLSHLGAEIEHAARLIREQSMTGLDPATDALVENLVARAFGLDRQDYQQIYETIFAVQDLVPVRAIKTISVDDIF
ncbi:MAG: N-6 DNA methylase [Anaerosomatales bacterium]|nr:N-6 DNA methylase [Anaerosomatales bacterium]